MNDSLLAELMICPRCHKPLEARSWESASEPESNPDESVDMICRVCLKDDQSEDWESEPKVFSSTPWKERNRPTAIPTDIEESVEYTESDASISRNSALEIPVLWDGCSPLSITGCSPTTSAEPEPKEGLTWDSVHRSRSSPDSGIVDPPSSAPGTDEQLFTFDRKSCGGDQFNASSTNIPQDSLKIASGNYSEYWKVSTNASEELPPSPYKAAPTLNFGKCPTHQTYSLGTYCSSCDQMICKTCAYFQHGGDHVIWRVDDFLFSRRHAMQKLADKMHTRMAECERTIAENKTYETGLMTKKRLLQTSLEDRGRYYHRLVDKWVETTTTKLEQAFAQELETIHEAKSEAEKLLQQMETAQARVATFDSSWNSVQGFDPQELISQGKLTIAELIRQSNRKSPRSPIPHCFVLSGGNGLNLQTLGTFSKVALDTKSVRDSQPHPKIFSRDVRDRVLPTPFVVSKPKHLRSFESRRSHKQRDYMASGLAILSNGHLLVSDMGTDTVKTFDTRGVHEILYITLPEDHPARAVQLQNGNIAVACKNDVKFFVPEGDFLEKLGQDLYSPQSVTLDPEGNLAVLDVTKNGSRVVKVYHRKDHKLLQTVCFSPDLEQEDAASSQTESTKSEHHPWFFHITPGMDILVTDATDHTIKAFSETGSLLWTAGHKGAGPAQFFSPAGLCRDAFGHVLVADCGNSRVHMLSPNGDFLTVIVSEEDDIECPMDVALDEDGVLWVLQANGQVKAFQYIV